MDRISKKTVSSSRRTSAQSNSRDGNAVGSRSGTRNGRANLTGSSSSGSNTSRTHPTSKLQQSYLQRQSKIVGSGTRGRYAKELFESIARKAFGTATVRDPDDVKNFERAKLKPRAVTDIYDKDGRYSKTKATPGNISSYKSLYAERIGQTRTFDNSGRPNHRVIDEYLKYFDVRQEVYVGVNPIDVEMLNILDTATNVAIAGPSSVLHILRNIRFRDDVTELGCAARVSELDISHLVKPPPYQPGTFIISEDKASYLFHKYTSLPNFDVSTMPDQFEKLVYDSANMLKISQNDQTYFVSKKQMDHEFLGNIKLLTDWTSQYRVKHYHNILLAAIESCAPHFSLDDRSDIVPRNSIPLALTRRILDYYPHIPIYDDGTTTSYDTRYPVSSQLPYVLATLLNIHFAWVTGEITRFQSYLACEFMCSASSSAFFDYYLSNRDFYRIGLFESLSSQRKVTHLQFDEHGDILKICDAILSEYSDKDMLDAVKNARDTRSPLFDLYLARKIQAIKDVTDIVQIHSFTRRITNSGLYIKTPVALLYHKSVMPQQVAAIAHYVSKSDEVGNIIELVGEDVLQQIYDLTVDLAKQVPVESLEHMNFTQEFISLLTTNSAGAKKLDIAALIPDSADEQTRRNIQQMSRNRLASALLTLAELNDPLTVRELDMFAYAGTRFQIDRRSRIISMVQNALQLAGTLRFLAISETLYDNVAFSSGKGQGNILDMIKQVFTSSHTEMIKMDFDQSAADQHQRNHLLYITFKYCFELYGRIQTPLFFGYYEKDITVNYTNALGNIVKRDIMHLTAAQVCLLETARVTWQQQYFLSENIHTEGATLLPVILSSGLWDTNAHHNLVMFLVEKAIDMQLYLEVPSAVKIIGISGDDFMSAIWNISIDDFETKYRQRKIAILRRLNLEVSGAPSFYVSTYLQLDACLGMYMPKADRLSFVTSERSETQKLAAYKQFDEIVSVLNEISGRVPYPEQCPVIGRALWNVIRYDPVGYKKHDLDYTSRESEASQINSIAKLRKSEPPYHIGDDKIHYILPFLICSNFNSTSFPMINLITPAGVCVEHSPWLLSRSQYVESRFLLATIPSITLEEYILTHINEKKRIEDSISRMLASVNKRVTDVPNLYPFLLNQLPAIRYLFVDHKYLEQIRYGEIRFVVELVNREMDAVRVSSDYDLVTNHLTKRLESFQDQIRRQKSQISIRALKAYGLDIPIGITYLARPKQRVEKMVASIVIAQPEIAKIRTLAWKHSRSSVLRPYTISTDTRIMMERSVVFGDHMRYSFHKNISRDVPPNIAYGRSPASTTFYNHFGMLTTHLGKTDIRSNLYVEFMPGLNVDTMLEFAMKNYDRLKGHFDTFLDAVGIEGKVRTKVLRAIESLREDGRHEYYALIPPRASFYYNFSIPAVLPHISYDSGIADKRKWMAIYFHFGRDALLHGMNTYAGRQITII